MHWQCRLQAADELAAQNYDLTVDSIPLPMGQPMLHGQVSLCDMGSPGLTQWDLTCTNMYSPTLSILSHAGLAGPIVRQLWKSPAGTSAGRLGMPRASVDWKRPYCSSANPSKFPACIAPQRLPGSWLSALLYVFSALSGLRSWQAHHQYMAMQ